MSLHFRLDHARESGEVRGMRFLLATWGSFGDLHPFLSLGAELVRRGHSVKLVGLDSWKADVAAAGIEFVSGGMDVSIEDLKRNPEIFSPANYGLTSVRALMRDFVAPSFAPMAEAMTRAAAGCDCLVAHSFVLVAPAVAEKTGIRFASASLAPGVIPSAYSMPSGALVDPWRGPLGRCVNSMIWKVGMWVSRPCVDPALNAFRASQGLSPVRDAILTSASRELHLQLYSGAFAPPEPDWHPSLRQAGFCFWDGVEAWEPPPELVKFLDAGPKPVLFTLGTSAVVQPMEFYRAAVEAVRGTGERGILLTGFPENAPADLPSEVMALEYAPYGWIMPRCAAVAHQCGIGTLAQALRAGLPSVLCPYAFDQPNNAMRVQALGAGVVLPRGRRGVGEIRGAIRRILGEEAFRRRAGEIAKEMAGEDGPAKAAGELERWGEKG